MAQNAYEEKDMMLWNAYKGGDADAKWALLHRFKGTINQVATQQSNVLPRPVVEAKLKRYAIQAFNTYDPSKNVKLSTHIYNYMQKIHRDNYQNQQAIRLPENVAINYNRYMEGFKFLTESLKREPNTAEMADYLGWSIDATANAAKKYHKEYAEGKQTWDAGIVDSDMQGSAIRFVYHGLSDPERYIFEHRTGYLDKPLKSPVEIQKDLGVTSYQFYQMQNRIRDNLTDALQTLAREE